MLPAEPTRNQLQSAAPMLLELVPNKKPAPLLLVLVKTKLAEPRNKCSSHETVAKQQNTMALQQWGPERTAAGPAAAAPMPSKQLHNKILAGGCETVKHHGPEGRNDLQKHAVPGLDVPSLGAGTSLLKSY